MSATRELQRRLRAEKSQPNFEPCLPRPTKEPPVGPGWIHESSTMASASWRTAKARHPPDEPKRPRLATVFRYRGGCAGLPVHSCVIDGEAIATDEKGLSVFDLVRYRRQDDGVLLCAFVPLEVNGEDIRQDGIEERKRRLAGLLRRPHNGMALNGHYRGDVAR